MTIQIFQLFASFLGPIVAATVVMLGWRRTHTDASSRDLENWRRTTLATAVTEMIAEAEDILHTDPNNDDKENLRKRRLSLSSMEQKKSLVLMCDSGIIWDCCNSYIRSVRDLMIAQADPDRDANHEELSRLIKDHQRMESYLIDQLPVSIKLRPAKPYDPMYAAIIRSEPYSKNQIRWRKLLRKLNNSTLPKERRKPWTKHDEVKETVLQ